MKIRKHRLTQPLLALKLPGLLVKLGFARSEVCRRKSHSEPSLFYRHDDRRNEWALREIYKQAQEKYRHRLKQVHPDKGGNHEDCASLNQLWERIEYLLTQRGLEI